MDEATAQSNNIQDIRQVLQDEECGLILEKNVSIPLRTSNLPVRCNVYRPIGKEGDKFPVLITYGPYGKDIPYEKFFPSSWNEVEAEHKSKYSAWETPDPVYWTRHGYAIVRVDERGLGQSPGVLDTMSRGTSECFFDVIEWASEQAWSTGKVGLLGISYFAGTQWRVAARKPKGLSAIIPWEGMADYYRDRCRHGGILSDNFIKVWWNRQVVNNQYGRPGRAAAEWGEDTIEGDLSEAVLLANRRDQNTDNQENRFRDDEYYASKDFDLVDIEVPLLSVANWGGISLHLRGNVEGYTWASSEFKYLRFLTGRHDLPFYYPKEVELQMSFFDAFLKGNDTVGWATPGKVSPISLILRKGDVGFNNPELEARYERRNEAEWPIKRTLYIKYHLTPAFGLSTTYETKEEAQVAYKAMGGLDDLQLVQFTTAAFKTETEITGHVTAHLNVSMTPEGDAAVGGNEDLDIDIFVTLRYISPDGREVHYTGTAGDPVPLTKGWLRVSLRKVNNAHRKHRDYLPYRDYLSTDVQRVDSGKVYTVDIELWPTNVVAEKGGKIVFEVASGDTQGSGMFQHKDPVDRPRKRLEGTNYLRFGGEMENYVTLPIVPPM